MCNRIIQHTHVPKIVLLVIICLLFLFSGCSKDETTYLYAPLSIVPTSYDPQIATGTDAETILNNCFEGLVRIDSEGNIKNGVAESYSISDDGLTYTFKLRSDALWYVPKSASEVLGEDYADTFDCRVTANDFVFAIKRVLDPGTGAPSAASLAIVTDVYAADDFTLVIKLSHPSASFIETLASPACMPCNEEFFEATIGRYGLKPSLLLSNGPYYLSSFDEETGIVTLQRNKSYEGEAKSLSDVVKLCLSSNEDLPDFDIATYTSSEKDNIPSSYTTTRYKNTVKAFVLNSNQEIFANSALRLQFAMATDTSLFVTKETPQAEGLVPSSCVLVAGSSYRANSNIVKGPNFSVETATQNFLEAAEKEKITSISIKIICTKSDEQNVKKVVQDWQKVFGTALSTTVDAYETQEELNIALASGNFDIAYTSITTYSFLATDFLASFKTDNTSNVISLNSEEYNTLISNAYNSSSKEELLISLKNAESFLLDNAYLIPTVFDDTYIARSENGSEISVRPSGTIMSFYK